MPQIRAAEAGCPSRLAPMRHAPSCSLQLEAIDLQSTQQKGLYMYLYIYIYVYVIHIYISLCVCIHIYTYIYLHIHIYMEYVYTYPPFLERGHYCGYFEGPASYRPPKNDKQSPLYLLPGDAQLKQARHNLRIQSRSCCCPAHCRKLGWAHTNSQLYRVQPLRLGVIAEPV